MTDTTLELTVVPNSLQVSMPNEYQVAELVLTITNQSSAAYDLTRGLSIVIPVDPGGSGSAAALVLSSASYGTASGSGQATPIVTVPVEVSVTEGDWSIDEISPGTCNYRALPNDSGMLAAGDALQFAFSKVAADLVEGSADITVAGTGLSLTATVIKTPSPPTITFSAVPALLIPAESTTANNTTQLNWQVLGAASCELTWLPTTTTVDYNGEQYHGTWSSPAMPLQTDAVAPVATLYEDTTFTLKATGQGTSITAIQSVTLASPTLRALTIPDVPAGLPAASDAPGSGPAVSGVKQTGAGDPDGGQQVTVSGTGFTGATSVGFGHASTSDFTVDAAGATITLQAPPAASADVNGSTPGTTVNVTVTVGTGEAAVTSQVTPADAYVYANQAASVSPYQEQFQLVWSCFDGTDPTLNWELPAGVTGVTDDVTVTAGSSGSVSNGGAIAASDKATVTISAPTTFSVQVTPTDGPKPTPVTVGIDALVFDPQALMAGSPSVAADGTQSATLSWTAQNATGYTLTGGGIPGNSIILPHDQNAYQVAALPLTGGPPSFTLNAMGFDENDLPTSLSSSTSVYPCSVDLTSFTASPPSIDQGNSVTLSWAATAATRFLIAEGATAAQSFPPSVTNATFTPIETTMYTLTAEGYSLTGTPPSKSVTVAVTVKKPKDTKEFHTIKEMAEKAHPNQDNPAMTAAVAGTVPGPGDLADPDPALAGGTQEAFIRPGERPGDEVPGVAGPDAPTAPQG
jgi:hypothetical protein